MTFRNSDAAKTLIERTQKLLSVDKTLSRDRVTEILLKEDNATWDELGQEYQSIIGETMEKLHGTIEPDESRDPNMRELAEKEIRDTVEMAMATGGYDGGDIRACLDRILDILMNPTEAVYHAAASGIPLEMTGNGIHARVTARDAVRAHIEAVKDGK